MFRPWAFWRRTQYGAGFATLLGALVLYTFWSSFFPTPTCNDGRQNGTERGVDCGGSCSLICAFDVTTPTVSWARSFKVVDGQYNAIAYVENRNATAATEELPYTLQLFDNDGLILERQGTTVLPPDSEYPIFAGRLQTGQREPTRTVLALGEPSGWYPSEQSRDSFTTETFELTGAGDDPKLTAKITNNEFTEARNIEVVATIFDRNNNALTASETVVDIFPPRTTKDVVFTWPEPIASTVRSCEIPTDVVLAIDLSGSMNNDGGTPPQPISAVLAAAEQFLARLRPADQASVITFASQAKTVQPLTADVTQAEQIVRDLAIDPAEEQGNTNTGAAFQAALDQFTSSAVNPDARKVMVVLTDGLATAPDDTEAGLAPDAYAITQAETVKSQNVEVYSIGLGSEVNMDFVRTLASDAELAYTAPSVRDIERIYRSITTALCEDGPARIDIIPKATDIIE